MKPILAHVGKLAALGSQLVAGLLLALGVEMPGLPRSFIHQAAAALGVAAGLTAASFALKSRTALLAVAGTQLFIVLVLGYPLGASVDIEVLLSIGLALFVTEVLPHPVNLVFGLAAIACSMLTQRPVLAWGERLPAPAAGSMLLLAAAQAMALLAGLTLGRLLLLHRREVERNAQLAAAVDRLTSANLGFQEYARASAEQSRINERNRITREIHDVVGYTLTNISMMMEDAIDSCRHGSPGKLLALVVNSRDQARNGHEEIRKALRRLSSIEKPESRGIGAFHRLVGTFREATGVRVDIDSTNLPLVLPEELELCLFRLIQEGLTNAFRHGQASRIRIVLAETDDSVVLSLADNGRGTGEVTEGMGLSGMKDRVRRLRGDIRFEGGRDGFRLSARIPKAAVPAGEAEAG